MFAAAAVPGFARSWSRWRTLATQTVDASLGRLLIVSAGLVGAVRRDEDLFGCSSVQAAARHSNPTAAASLLRIRTPTGGDRSEGRGAVAAHVGKASTGRTARQYVPQLTKALVTFDALSPRCGDASHCRNRTVAIAQQSARTRETQAPTLRPLLSAQMSP